MKVDEKKRRAISYVNVWPLLLEELTKDENWSTVLPKWADLAVTIKKVSKEENLIRPLGNLIVSQKVVPLNYTLTKFGAAEPKDYFKFEITGADSLTLSTVKDYFAPAQYAEGYDSEKLSHPPFEKLDAGVSIHSSDVSFDSDSASHKDMAYETIIIRKETNERISMSTTELGKYTFLPWVKAGIGAQITNNENELSGHRAQIQITLNVRRYDEESNPVSELITKNITFYGPGDIVGFLNNIVIRTEPKPYEPNYESNYFPYIEFSQLDFPWRFTPAMPNANSPSIARLSPWLCLIVLKREEFEGPISIDRAGGLLPQIKIHNPEKSLPDLEQFWAWAHCQIPEKVKNPEEITEILVSQPHKPISRILCPRRLEPNTPYHAFVVPLFEVGRLAGLGEEVGEISGTDFAWKVTGSDKSPPEHTLPVYYNWQFNTGERGDFETLVRKVVQYRDVKLIHTWKHFSPAEIEDETSGERTVLIIKGELSRRYPNAVVYASKAIFHNGKPTLPSVTDEFGERIYSDLEEEIKEPIFRSIMHPDVIFVGFDIRPDELRGNLEDTSTKVNAGWFFVIQEQLPELRFGLDERKGSSVGNPTLPLNNWDDLSWDYMDPLSDSNYIVLGGPLENNELKARTGSGGKSIGGVEWRSHAGDMANIALQQPVRIAIHASALI